MHSCGSFVRQARLQFAGLHSLFLALWCIVIEIGGMMKNLLFWNLMYLYSRFIRCRRYFFDNWCICTALIFIVADALLGINTSATCFSSNLQILLSLPVMYNCIYILPFLWPEDASRRNFASSTCSFHNLQILPSQILHLHPTFSITWRCSPSKFCIFNPQKSTIADISPYSLNSMACANTLLTKKLI